MNGTAKACNDFGLTISIKQTQHHEPRYSYTSTHSHRRQPARSCDRISFFILGLLSLTTHLLTQSSTKELGKPLQPFQDSPNKSGTKIKVYKACVLSTLLYAREAWTLKAKQEKRLHFFHMRNFEEFST